MIRRTILKIIFYSLIVGIAFSAGFFIRKTGGSPYVAGSPLTGQTSGVENGKPAAANDCIITIDGARYNVTPLRTTHPGGDIFSCGTDMSAIFHGQHGNNLKMIEKYLVK